MGNSDNTPSSSIASDSATPNPAAPKPDLNNKTQIMASAPMQNSENAAGQGMETEPTTAAKVAQNSRNASATKVARHGNKLKGTNALLVNGVNGNARKVEEKGNNTTQTSIQSQQHKEAAESMSDTTKHPLPLVIDFSKSSSSSIHPGTTEDGSLSETPNPNSQDGPSTPPLPRPTNSPQLNNKSGNHPNRTSAAVGSTSKRSNIAPNVSGLAPGNSSHPAPILHHSKKPEQRQPKPKVTHAFTFPATEPEPLYSPQSPESRISPDTASPRDSLFSHNHRFSFSHHSHSHNPQDSPSGIRREASVSRSHSHKDKRANGGSRSHLYRSYSNNRCLKEQQQQNNITLSSPLASEIPFQSTEYPLSPVTLSEIEAFVKLTAEAPKLPASFKPSQSSEMYSAMAAANFLGIPYSKRPATSGTNTPGVANTNGPSQSTHTNTPPATNNLTVPDQHNLTLKHSKSSLLAPPSARTSFDNLSPRASSSSLVSARASSATAAATFPHIVRPVPVFVSDQVTQSRKTTIASYMAGANNTNTNGPSLSTPSEQNKLNGGISLSLPSSQAMGSSGAGSGSGSAGGLPNGADVSPSGATTNPRPSNLKLALPTDAPPSIMVFPESPIGNGNGLSPYNSHSEFSNSNGRLNGNGLGISTTLANNYSGLRHHSAGSIIIPSSPISITSTMANGSAQYSYYQNELMHDRPSQLVQTVLAEKHRQLVISSGASRWTSFVAATMPTQVQTAGLGDFEQTTRVQPEDLDAQIDLDGAWGGMDDDGSSTTSSSAIYRVVNYLLCCFMSFDDGSNYTRDMDEESTWNEKSNMALRGRFDANHPDLNEKNGVYPRSNAGADSDNHSGSLNHRGTRFNQNYGGNVRRFVETKKRKWQPKFFYIMLNNPLIPLTLRLFNIILSILALALACSVFVKSHHSGVPQQPSTIMAIVVQTCATVYLAFISYDEYSSKPLGLRDSKDKMRLIMLDLLFIIFASANLSLAFNTLFDPMWLCQDDGYIEGPTATSSTPTATSTISLVTATSLVYGSGNEISLSLYDPSVCRRQRGLVSFLLVILASWIITFTISMFRLMERISGA